MILGDPQQATVAPGASATLEDLFRRAAQRHPERIALVDPPNRASFTDGELRSLTYAQADRMITAIAKRLRALGLPPDTIVGIQLPNTVESVLTLLGVLRAGMIAAPLPMLWRRAEIVAALGRVGAKALITCRRIGAVDHADLAMQAAVDIFPIRYVCAFNSGLPDGVVPLDELYGEAPVEPPEMDPARAGHRAAHLALITWETDTLAPVARNHAEIVAGGLAVLLEGGFEDGARFVSALPVSSFAGLAVTMLPWLLTDGTLMLHQPFDPEILAAQLRDGCDAVILPAPAIPRLAEAGFFTPNVRSVMALWRAPERIGMAPAWSDPFTSFIDIACFGEAGVIPARRGANGQPATLPFGVVTAPRGAPGAVLVAELTRKYNNLAVSGPMVPRHAYPSGAENTGLPCFRTAHGVVDTGYPCRLDAETCTLAITGSPAGVADVGGYRFGLRDVQNLVADADGGGRIAALPDPLSGHRLAGSAGDRNALRNALIKQGVNPLVADAFA